MTLEIADVAAVLTIGTVPPIQLENVTGHGVRFEWDISKVRGPSPDQGTITIYNLWTVSRLALAAFKATPAALQVTLFIGWKGVPESVFRGIAWRVMAERKQGTDVLTELQIADGAIELRDTPPAGTVDISLGIVVAIVNILAQLQIPPSPGALTAMQTASASVVVTQVQWVSDGDIREFLDNLVASLDLSWGIVDGFFEVYQNGARQDIPPYILTPQTGLLRWEVLDDGGVEFEALARPRVGPGVQVIFEDELSVPIAPPTRVERIQFTGSTDGPSLMSGLARKMAVL